MLVGPVAYFTSAPRSVVIGALVTAAIGVQRHRENLRRVWRASNTGSGTKTGFIARSAGLRLRVKLRRIAVAWRRLRPASASKPKGLRYVERAGRCGEYENSRDTWRRWLGNGARRSPRANAGRCPLWARDAGLVEERTARRANAVYLPDVALPPRVIPVASLERAMEGAELLISAVPSHGVRTVWRAARQFVPRGTAIVSATKGPKPTRY